MQLARIPAGPPGDQVNGEKLPGMAWIPGGTFLTGINDEESFPNERPARLVDVRGFWIDEHDVTNAEFAKFVKATGYVTTAERPVNWEDLRKELPPSTPKPVRLANKLANENLEAAEMNQDASMNWGAWGGMGWIKATGSQEAGARERPGLCTNLNTLNRHPRFASCLWDFSPIDFPARNILEPHPDD